MTSWISIRDEVKKMEREKVNTIITQTLQSREMTGLYNKRVSLADLDEKVVWYFDNMVLLKEDSDLYCVIYNYIVHLNPRDISTMRKTILGFILYDLCTRYSTLVEIFDKKADELMENGSNIKEILFTQA